MNQYPDGAVIKTYSLTLTHTAKVAEMAEKTGKGQSELIRQAIDLLYEALIDESKETPADPLSEEM